MKTRNVLLALAAAAAVPAFAFTGNNTCGLVRIDSGSTNTVIGVPWVEVGTGADITVAKLVSTANLTVNDELRYYDGSNWYGWTLTSTGWQGLTTVTDVGNEQLNPPTATEAAIVRGKALVLVRQNPKTGDTVNPFYLYGQYANATVAAQTIARVGSAPVYMLLASPYAAEFNLNGEGKITGMGADDQVIFYDSATGAQKFYKYFATAGANNAAGWCRETTTKEQVTRGGRTVTMTKTVWASEDTKIPAGQGFWYVAASGSGSVTVNW